MQRGKKIIRVLKDLVLTRFSDDVVVEDVEGGILIKVKNGNSGRSS